MEILLKTDIPSIKSKKAQMKFEKKMSKVSSGASVVPATVAAPLTVPGSTGLSREELQAKLKAKMDSFKSKRGAEAPKSKKQSHDKATRREKKLAIKKAQKESIEQKKQAQASAVLEGGHQIFSKFDFGLGKVKKEMTPKNPKQALQMVESRMAKLQKLSIEDKGKAEQLQKSEAWAKAIQKAQGLIVKDDPKLLKKSIQRLEKAKEKRTDKWNERQQGTKDAQLNRQKKRQENLDKRKEQAKVKKFGGGVTKKRPGFEGGHFKKVQKRK